MNRKQFVGALVALGASGAEAQQAQQSDPQQGFRQDWIKSLMENMDAQLDIEDRERVMQACGRACARRGSLKPLQAAAQGSVDKLVAALGSHLGAGNAKREGDVVKLKYEKCYCPLVAAGPARLSNTYCHCSQGWVMEIFEKVSGKKVEVTLLRSIKRGDAACEFAVKV